jgi:polar amino acid transport system substrate-binding protein
MKIVPLLLGVVVTLTTAAGCAGQEEPDAGKPVDRLAEAQAALPDSIKQSGVLNGGTDPSFEPMTFMKGDTFSGLDAGLAEAIAGRLGLKVQWHNVGFGDLLDQVEDHKLDFSMSSMFDRAERQKQADFVNYLNAGTSIVVPKGEGDIGGMAGLCGRRVATQPDTVFVEMAEAQKKDCGGKTMSIVLTAAPSAAVRDGRADAALNDFPIAALDVEKMPTLELSGPQIEAIPYGIGVAKDRKDLTMAFQAALYSLINDGTYDKLLAEWKVNEGALRTGAINGGA